jgi:hypothetical protein
MLARDCPAGKTEVTRLIADLGRTERDHPLTHQDRWGKGTNAGLRHAVGGDYDVRAGVGISSIASAANVHSMRRARCRVDHLPDAQCPQARRWLNVSSASASLPRVGARRSGSRRLRRTRSSHKACESSSGFESAVSPRCSFGALRPTPRRNRPNAPARLYRSGAAKLVGDARVVAVLTDAVDRAVVSVCRTVIRGWAGFSVAFAGSSC